MSRPSRSVWAIAEGVATIFMCAATTARTRMLDHASALVRMMAQRDSCFYDAALLERELAVFRSQRQSRPARQRPHYAPGERAQILEVMRLRGWSVKQTAQRFVLHPNTIRSWIRAIGDDKADGLFGRPAWNTIHEGVRRVVRELRATFPEPEFGTRTIARHLLRAGIRISRSSVRRVLQEELQGPRGDRGAQRVTQAPEHVQHPTQPHQVWHMDMTEIRVLWITVVLTAIVDGFTRRIIALRAARLRPTSDDLAGLIKSCAERLDVTPRFLVTDHGCQFRQRFEGMINDLGIRHIQCQVRTWQINAKVERVFNDVKKWARRSWLPLDVDRVQLRLDAYRDWHNGFKPHAAHGTMTPMEAERGSPPPEPVAYVQRGGVEPIIAVQRQCVRGDPRLAYPVIRVTERRLDAA